MKKKARAEFESLSADQMLRLQRLADLAKVRPEDVWLDVWRYGWDDVEDSISAELEAQEYFKTNPGIPHAEVMAEAWEIIAQSGKRKREGR
ncbi:MAG: hypothetical protein V4578_00570 [Pseudomonadota bacterium]